MPGTRRSPQILALVGLFVLLTLALARANLAVLSGLSAGFAFDPRVSGEVYALAITQPALQATADHRGWQLRAINGTRIGSGPHALSAIAERVQRAPGALNRFELTSGSALRQLDLPVAEPQLSILFRSSPETLLYPWVGLSYLALGLWVWWRRPDDRAASPMLLLTLVVAVALECNFGLDAVARAAGVLESFSLPLFAPALLHFGLRFTGNHQSRGLRALASTVLATALGLGAVEALPWGASSALLQGVQLAIGALLATSVSITAVLGMRVARSSSPLALRRRGRLLAQCGLVAFFVPSSSMLLPNVPGQWLLNAALLLAFPIAMAYAIVRHNVFNFRVVLRQRLVHGLLSLSASMLYLALTLLALELAGATEGRALSLGIGTLLVLVLTLLHLRLQRGVHEYAYRSRYSFSDAISLASARLANAQTRAAVCDVVRQSLLEPLELTRAGLLTAPLGKQAHWRCHWLSRPLTSAEQECVESALLKPLLPEPLFPERYAPLARALATRATVTAYDSAAASAQVAQLTQPDRTLETATQGRDEGAFWPYFGLEAVVPLRLGAGSRESRVVGLLLLGPKRGGKPLNSSDERLVLTLADQLAMALEHAAAFDEIRALHEGLERQVEERTRALSAALSELERAQLQLIESEKQAVLGRLVAGVTHEINTPLGTLRSAVDTLQRIGVGATLAPESRPPAALTNGQDLDGGARRRERSSRAVAELLELITSSADRLHQLVRRLERFANVDQGAHQALDLRESIAGALSVLGPGFTPQISVRQSYEDGGLTLYGDRAKLGQLFWNLLQNALTALNGQGEIRIEARRQDDRIEIELTDNGVGIAKERLPELFNFGFTQKNGRVGLRLGLPTSKLTVAELGGDISIESTPGRGTSVRLSLPIHPPISGAASRSDSKVVAAYGLR
ncbi:MAG: hypothetical protein RL685_356 [Pseudomonadota bacterium]